MAQLQTVTVCDYCSCDDFYFVEILQEIVVVPHSETEFVDQQLLLNPILALLTLYHDTDLVLLDRDLYFCANTLLLAVIALLLYV